ncbi:hypothetical protein HBI26_061140 [Parastagonospora nodorum]|nr:hypothetical protein HBI26_061140 [Parastagonospora nodorum]
MFRAVSTDHERRDAPKQQHRAQRTVLHASQDRTFLTFTCLRNMLLSVCQEKFFPTQSFRRSAINNMVSPFVLHPSLFTLRYSPFVIHPSLFTLRYSPFVIHPSLFTLRYPPFVLAAGLLTASTVIQSPVNPNITITYRSPDSGTCATTFGTQKQCSSYISLPPLTLAPHQQNLFWFFEARTHPETAALTIRLNGGPGASTIFGLFEEICPCEILQLPNGSYSTRPRVWGWDRSSNLLFIDQPTQIGFSYDEFMNKTFDYVKTFNMCEMIEIIPRLR